MKRYCVVDYRTMAVVHAGDSEFEAAVALNPGTVYGVATQPDLAEWKAMVSAMRWHDELEQDDDM
jgi:hypothetical protein